MIRHSDARKPCTDDENVDVDSHGPTLLVAGEELVDSVFEGVFVVEVEEG